MRHIRFRRRLFLAGLSLVLAWLPMTPALAVCMDHAPAVVVASAPASANACHDAGAPHGAHMACQACCSTCLGTAALPLFVSPALDAVAGSVGTEGASATASRVPAPLLQPPTTFNA